MHVVFFLSEHINESISMSYSNIVYNFIDYDELLVAFFDMSCVYPEIHCNILYCCVHRVVFGCC